jgi:hypothetical protein
VSIVILVLVGVVSLNDKPPEEMFVIWYLPYSPHINMFPSDKVMTLYASIAPLSQDPYSWGEELPKNQYPSFPTAKKDADKKGYDYVVGTVPYDGILKNSKSVVVGATDEYKKSDDAKTYKIASSTLVYEVDKDGVVVAEFADIEEGDIVLVLEEEKAADNGIANIVVIVNDNADDYDDVVKSAESLDATDDEK